MLSISKPLKILPDSGDLEFVKQCDMQSKILEEPNHMRRVHISGVFDNPYKPDAKNVAISLSNDVLSIPHDISQISKHPMLVYDTFVDVHGDARNKFTTLYNAEEFDAMIQIANKEGDALVFNAMLYEFEGGLRVDVHNLAPTTIPFSKKQHRNNTMVSRNSLDYQSVNLESAIEL